MKKIIAVLAFVSISLSLFVSVPAVALEMPWATSGKNKSLTSVRTEKALALAFATKDGLDRDNYVLASDLKRMNVKVNDESGRYVFTQSYLIFLPKDLKKEDYDKYNGLFVTVNILEIEGSRDFVAFTRLRNRSNDKVAFVELTADGVYVENNERKSTMSPYETRNYIKMHFPYFLK